ncbi:MAG: hypothetical protein ABSF26_21635, partial [Thermoguttaceae bacterium]
MITASAVNPITLQFYITYYLLPITYRWEAEPMGRDFETFVHFVGPGGKMMFQSDHISPAPTS